MSTIRAPSARRVEVLNAFLELHNTYVTDDDDSVLSFLVTCMDDNGKGYAIRRDFRPIDPLESAAQAEWVLLVEALGFTRDGDV